jgi:hypothetical protein
MNTDTAQLIITLSQIQAQLTRIEAKLGGGSSSRGGNVADDADLDGQYGDPEVRKDPKQWLNDGGASYAGRRMSECPSDYLLAVASFYEWRAGKEEAEPEKAKYAAYSRRDAARARGWAARNKGKAPQPRAAAPAFDAADAFGDDDAPF